MKVKKINFKRHITFNGSLCAYEKKAGVPFRIKRVFTVWAKRGDIRGLHAHKTCSQLLICVHGKIRVECEDGKTKKRIILRHEGQGLLIPPKIWAKQQYLDSKAVMIVLCNKEYNELDYIRNYNKFKKYISRKNIKNKFKK